jgi:hypothetical protein
MCASVVDRLQRSVGEVGGRKVRDGVAAWLEEQDGVVALHHGSAAELGAHATPQRLGVKHALWNVGHEESAVGVTTEWPLLP